MKEYIRKADIILAIVLLVASFCSLILLRGNDVQDLKAVVYHEGKVIDSIDLSRSGEYSMTYELYDTFNTVHYEDGAVWMEDADCPGKDCMQFGKISKAGQVIICAPHKLLIQITGGDGVDTAAY